MGVNVNIGEIAEITDLNGTISPFEQHPIGDLSEPGPCVDSSDFELRTIIRRHEELPEIVRHTEFNVVEERRLNKKLITTLLTQPPPQNCQGDWELRLQKRKDTLIQHQGKVLHCVFIGLPGAHYTIEVDLKARAVVHWEWQHA